MRTSKFRVLRLADDYGTDRWEYLELPRDVQGETWMGQVDYNWETWSQYTDQDAANGEIYEGDILQMDDATAKVVFWERPPAFGLDYSHNEDKWCEDWNLTDDSLRMQIIGNIWQNPELLRTQVRQG